MLCFALALPACCAPSRIVAARTAVAPVLDGKLNDAVWAKAKESGGFTRIGRKGLRPQAPTYVKALVSGDSLYIGFRCVEPNMKALKATIRPKNTSVWLDDSIEVILDPANTRKQVYHLIVNAAGCQYGVPCKVTALEHADDQQGWDGKWTVKAARESGQWTVEIRLPMAVFGIDVNANPCLGIQFARERVGAREESSTWSPTRMTFANPSGLGEILLPKDNGNYCLLDTAKPLLNMESVPFSVTNSGKTAIRPRLHFAIDGEENASGQVETGAIAADKKASGVLPISIKEPGDYHLALKMVDAVTGECIYTRDQRFVVAPALAVENLPFSLYANKAQATITPGLASEKLAGCVVRASLCKVGSTANIATKTLPCKTGVATSVAFDLQGQS